MSFNPLKSNPRPPYSLNSLTDIDTTFGGVRIQQTWSALFMLGKLIEEEEITNVVQLGRGTGALHDFFRCYCLTYSYDLPQDVFQAKIIIEIEKLVQNTWTGKYLIFCDDGDKPRELRTYANILKRGDHILVHDYRRTGGITFRQVLEIMEDKDLEFYRQQEFDDLQTYIVSLRKK